MLATLRAMFAAACFFSWLAGVAIAQRAADASAVSRGRTLVMELGCASCHTELGNDTTLRERTPDLSSAGRRYQPAWLFDYLQNPTKVRHHLGRARMPSLHLGVQEALALTEFLGTQRRVAGQWPGIPPGLKAQTESVSGTDARSRFQAELAGGLACLTCHKLEGSGGSLGIDLETVGHRLQQDWVKEYLVAPARFGVSPAAMPAQFYQLDGDGKSFQEITPRAADRIQIVADFLFSLGQEKRAALLKPYQAAKKSFPDATSTLGEALFKSLNCAACHRHDAIAPRKESAAPDLTREGIRVHHAWLESYLARPTPIRPFGYQPGDGSRMPDFRLAPEEARDIAAFLGAQREGAKDIPAGFRQKNLSAFSRNKAKLIITEKLACLGCHRLGEPGGRIGPDLTSVGTRLQPGYLYGIIKNPQAVAPHSVMPKSPMPDDTAQLIANYLVAQQGPVTSSGYLSVVDQPLVPPDAKPSRSPSSIEGGRLYLSHCAACHGTTGRGDGFNARFLPVKPTNHADPAYLSARPDDTLFDGIHAGGYILNRSHMMPAWGETFTPREIRELVGVIRTLCACQPPGWSRDNSSRP